ncbi:GNAT family N-acetyltransferase [Bordetella petrii]|uniref:GNAT family N-acetyltransferase n=1 Tax=Bordetella petrii TaxID=94624 RepID=UPI001E2CDAAA|nr:GNAT family N-acetyltransferase [Bordetella petrii]MCD0502862.1 GNAT family N-acetyltransferase [Bordetella petrii]
MADIVVRHAESDADLSACFLVAHQLRPHLAGSDDFIERVRRMAAENYRVLAVWDGGTVLALAGYRLQENLIYGRFLYVDDLVTTAASRGHQFGARLLDELSVLAAHHGCEKLVLDTGLSNALAQRFYFRQGLVTGAMRFSKFIAQEN